MHISEYVCKTFLEELTFLCREIIAACNVSKNTAFPQAFFCHILKEFPNNSDPLQRHFLPFHFNKSLCIIPIHARKIFDPIARANAPCGYQQCFSNDELRRCLKRSK